MQLVQFYYPKWTLKVPLGHILGSILPRPGQKYLGGQGMPVWFLCGQKYPAGHSPCPSGNQLP